jgi:UDP-glucose 4-epimerase
LLDVKDMLEEISGRELNLEIRPPRIGDIKHTLADISRAREELGYEPDKDFLAQLVSMAEWYKSSYPE